MVLLKYIKNDDSFVIKIKNGPLKKDTDRL